jgi:NADPH-dependent curcumin reductase CurA
MPKPLDQGGQPMTHPTNRQWLLARRPRGSWSADDFRWSESPAPEPAEGEVLVRNLYLSCDPTQRGWIAGDTYLPAVRIGEVMRSFAVGEVVNSRDPQFRPGELVQGLFGWQDYCATRQGGPYPILPVPSDVPIETAMSILGNTGMTAYFGLLDVGRPNPGETVVVSGAAGATGSAVGQIAKIKGCRAIGIAGGAEKCRYLTSELGFDAAIDYKSENVMTRLRETCPKGIDVYFDNVGGRILDAALIHLAFRGRVVICGAMSMYNEAALPPGPRNYLNLLIRRGRMEGFVVIDYMPRAAEAITALAGWLREGKLRDQIDLQHGLENAPAAVARLFKGENRGKQLLKIADRSPTLS